MVNSANEEYQAFVKAVLGRKLEAAKRFLDGKFDINSADTRGWTALHFAVENMLLDVVLFLLENGANPNQRDAGGQTPLHIAVDVDKDFGTHQYVIDGKFPPTAKLTTLLLENGADPNATTNSGKTPLALATGYAAALDTLRQHGAREK